jgi:transcriptional regulator with XRE-family HTH domain
VSRKSGVPLRTVQNYLDGRGLKFGPLITLATATGVSLDWLATGDGPMKSADFPEAAAPRAVGLADHQQAIATIKTVGDRLKATIEDAGGPLAVAERAGMSMEALIAAASGQVELRASALVALARACDVSLDWLATGVDPAPSVVPPVPAAPPTPDLPVLAKFFDLSVEVAKLAGQELDTATHLQRAWASYVRMHEPD